jgi:hypothetical protein
MRTTCRSCRELTTANVQDSTVYEELVDSIPPIEGNRGRPRKRLDKLHADKDYYPRCCRSLGRRGIEVRIAERVLEGSERLGRWRS